MNTEQKLNAITNMITEQMQSGVLKSTIEKNLLSKINNPTLVSKIIRIAELEIK